MNEDEMTKMKRLLRTEPSANTLETFVINCPKRGCDGTWKALGLNYFEAALDTTCHKCGHEISEIDFEGLDEGL